MCVPKQDGLVASPRSPAHALQTVSLHPCPCQAPRQKDVFLGPEWTLTTNADPHPACGGPPPSVPTSIHLWGGRGHFPTRPATAPRAFPCTWAARRLSHGEAQVWSIQLSMLIKGAAL